MSCKARSFNKLYVFKLLRRIKKMKMIKLNGLVQ